jgi:hypothetical protein
MLGSSHLISGLDVATGTFALMVFSACVAVFVALVLIRFAMRRAGEAGIAGVLWVFAVALIGATCAYLLFDRFAARDLTAERRAVETRSAELTARSLMPGSALGCLDAVANVLVENGCEKPLFASPEAVAAAVAYVDARISLLAASAALAEQDKGYRPAFERLRTGLEADRYGLVAHVLTTRGCKGADCAELKLLRDPARVAANMKTRAFEAALGAHALAWSSSGAGVAALASAPPPTAPLATTGTGPGTPVTSGGPAAGRFDFPSANSIPAVNIMSAEPGAPPAAAEPRPTVLPPKRPPAPAARNQGARQAAAPAPIHSPPPPPPAPPTQIAPEEPPPPPALPDRHTTR